MNVYVNSIYRLIIKTQDIGNFDRIMEGQPPKRDCLFNIWYFILAITYTVLGGYDDVRKYFIWLKPLPVLLLALQLHSFKSANRSVLFIELGLGFGIIGDIFLELTGSDIYFDAGVVSYFLGHLCYIYGFIYAVKLLQTQSSTRSSLFFSLIYGAIILAGEATDMYFIWDYLKPLDQIGFSVYAGALCLMSICAFYFSQKARYDANLKFASVAIFLGSLLFVASDVTLSERIRNDKIDGNTKRIMSYVVASTYWLAQFLIAQGAMKISTLSTIYVKKDQPSKEEQKILENAVKQTVVTSETITEPLL